MLPAESPLETAVYGAALALVQSSAWRACEYLFMSQSALVMAGLDCTSASALAGLGIRTPSRKLKLNRLWSFRGNEPYMRWLLFP